MILVCPVCLNKIDTTYYFSCSSSEYLNHRFHGIINTHFYIEMFLESKKILLFNSIVYGEKCKITFNSLETNIDMFERCQSLDIINQYLKLKSFL
jgi:hypothetical protein